jgi:hypothetical protein
LNAYARCSRRVAIDRGRDILPIDRSFLHLKPLGAKFCCGLRGVNRPISEVNLSLDEI